MPPALAQVHVLDAWDQLEQAVTARLGLKELTWHRFARGPVPADGRLDVMIRPLSAARAPLRCGGATTSLLATARLETPDGQLAGEATVCGRRIGRAPAIPWVDAVRHAPPCLPRSRAAWASLAADAAPMGSGARAHGLLDRALVAVDDAVPGLEVLGWDRCSYPATASAGVGPVLAAWRVDELGEGLHAVHVRLEVVAAEGTPRTVLALRAVGVRR